MNFEPTNPNLNPEYRLKKIISNYKKHGKIIVGVDFDSTIKDGTTGVVYKDIVDLLRIGNRPEISYCIWTANENEKEVISTWRELDLGWDYYNYSPISPSSIKPHFNILLDDSAGLLEASKLFRNFIHYLENKDNNEVH